MRMLLLVPGLIACLALTDEAALADPQLVLDGRVVGPDGGPAAGAHVLGTLEWDNQQSTFSVETIRADGTFEYRLTPSGSKLRSIRVFAYARGYSNAEEIRTPPWGAPSYQRVLIRLRPAVNLTVQVVDPSGAPVPTAVVTIAQASWSTEHPLKGVPQRVNAAGAVTFATVNDKDSLELLVTAPGYVTMHPSPEALDRPIRVELAPGGTALGRLLDQASLAPVVGCKLLTSAGEVVTDPAGGFRLDAPYGHISVTPSCPDYGTDWDLPSSGLAIPFAHASAGQPYILHARRNQRVTGTVVDRRGRPRAGVQIRRIFVPKNPYEPRFIKRGPPTEDATTDARGGFVFPDSAMDEFELFIEGPKPWRSKFKFAELKGPIAITLPG